MSKFELTPSTSAERKQLLIETVINTAVESDGTSKISKVSDHSVLSGVAGGISKVAGKAEKDIALVVAQIYPDRAYENQLDEIALKNGIGGRFGAIGSSTYIRLIADPETTYTSGVHYFIANNGIRFELEEDIQVGDLGFAYAKVRSTTIGSETNVEAGTIAKCNPQPSGHIACVNEYIATGGRDIESDTDFRQRIKDGANFIATGTLAMIEQQFMKINPKVMRVFNFGLKMDGKLKLAVLTQNGMNLTSSELTTLRDNTSKHFNLNDMRPSGSNFIGIDVVNIEYQPIDISMRCEFEDNVDVDKARIEMQIAISKYLDLRYFDFMKRQIEWDRMLFICQNIKGVKYIPDQYFYPRVDFDIQMYKLPRVRSFLILNLNGQVIVNKTNTLSPIYYPSVIDESFHQTMLRNN